MKLHNVYKPLLFFNSMLEKFVVGISLLSALEMGCQTEKEVEHPRVKSVCTYCTTNKDCLPNVESCSSVYVENVGYKKVCVREDEKVDVWRCGTSVNKGW